jgi:branched-chain amino acid transport system permease protein
VIWRSPRALAVGGGLLALALVPVAAAALNQPFYLDLFRRIMIFAIAALSLDLILGYGGMVSFGHAAYLGVGAYAVGVLTHHGVHNGLVQWGLAIAASALVALAIGAVSIRTSGVSFIMITLAFTQMLYYLGISIEEYGGDDGMRLAARSQFGGLVDLRDGVTFYYVVLAVLVACLFLGHRFVNARFGMVVRAAKSNEARARAIGFSPYRYKLVAFVLAGAMGGVAGALLVNHTEYLTPDFMHWTRSGEIMFMVILGGMGTLAGPVIGAVVLLLLEDFLSGWTVHWQIILGPFLVLVVLFAKRGLFGILPNGGPRPGPPKPPGRSSRPGEAVALLDPRG